VSFLHSFLLFLLDDDSDPGEGGGGGGILKERERENRRPSLLFLPVVRMKGEGGEDPTKKRKREGRWSLTCFSLLFPSAIVTVIGGGRENRILLPDVGDRKKE